MKFKFLGYNKIKYKEFEVNGITVFVGKNKEIDVIQKTLSNIIINTLIEREKIKKHNIIFVTNSYDYKKYIEAYPFSNYYKDNTTNNILNKVNVFISENCDINLLKTRDIPKGLEKFLFLKSMLENVNDKLKDNIFILEDVENDLHTELQAKYIEFLIMLQTKYNIKFIITTYSPFVLNAIEVFGLEKVRNNEYNFYNVFFDEKNNQIDIIEAIENCYYSIAKIFQDLENLKWELIEKNNKELEESI